MSDTVIKVENLGKKYIIGHRRERYVALRDVIANKFGSAFKPKKASTREEFWALKDVSFDIKRGNRIGVIGRNGAGKTTLLKLLSRITEPTDGRIHIRGRVASLLEVGTGFHPELTGSENIYLNGAILGMTRQEIRRKFDEIVAFAETEKFLDTPVKYYSSGMYVRLAFAVAAHLEPEILLIDEVLAVGDAEFQKKCLGKMEDVSTKEGRTIIFVSHNMAAIRQFCSSAILLKQGQLVLNDNTEKVVLSYLQSTSTPSRTNIVSEYGIELESIVFYDKKNSIVTDNLVFNCDYSLRLSFMHQNCLDHTAIVIRVYDIFGNLVSSLCSPEEGLAPFRLQGKTQIAFEIPRLQLLPGRYKINVFVYTSKDNIAYLAAEDVISFNVYPNIVNNGMWAYRADHGIVRISDGCSAHQLTQ